MSNHDGGDDPQIGRAQPSYIQVAEQLRDRILRGELPPGYRLPAEGDFGSLFGVSRSTVREALRQLAAEGLVETKRGATGGTFVVEVDTGRLEGMLGLTLRLLQAGGDALTFHELIEARRTLEIPAAGWAAERRTEEHLAQLRRVLEAPRTELSLEERYRRGNEFHFLVLRAAQNRLVQVMTRPLFVASQAHQDSLHGIPWDEMDEAHRELADAIEARDADAARALMAAHLDHIDDLSEPAEPAATRAKG